MRKIVVLLLIIALAAGVWYGYTTGVIDLSHPNSDNPLTAQNWQWESTTYASADAINANDPEDFVARFTADGQFSTGTDCNTAVGSYELTDSGMSIGQLAVTEIACSGETLEQVYLGDIQNVASYSVTDDNELLLYTADGATMRFGIQ